MSKNTGSFTFTPNQLQGLSSDVDIGTLEIKNITTNDGTIVDNKNGTLTFMPNSGCNGLARINFVVSDGTNTIASYATININTQEIIPATSNSRRPQAR